MRESSAAQAWGGARTGNEASLSDRVVRYAIDAELDPVKHTLTGKQPQITHPVLPVRSEQTPIPAPM